VHPGCQKNLICNISRIPKVINFYISLNLSGCWTKSEDSNVDLNQKICMCIFCQKGASSIFNRKCWLKFPWSSFTWGGGVYFTDGEPDLPALFEKRTEIIRYIKGCPLLNTFLFTLKFDRLSQFFKCLLKHGGLLIRIGSFF
jgi:hypothetical protein